MRPNLLRRYRVFTTYYLKCYCILLTTMSENSDNDAISNFNTNTINIYSFEFQ